MLLNDGSSYRVVTDPAAHLAQRDVFCFRAASARAGTKYVDTAFAWHRRELTAAQALLMYQFVWADAGTPEEQANYLADAIGTLRPHEMVMLDIEAGGGITDPADFTRRWLAVVEPALRTKAWVYVPSALADRLTRAVTGDRIVMAPRYSGTPDRGPAPWWPHDVHQYTDRGPFPGCTQTGDLSHTALTPQQLLDRCQPEGTTMAWRVARSLDKLLTQLNVAAPRRSKASDGSIGDAAHATRASDHNPWVVSGGMGIVTARDFTHDPANGLDCERLYQALMASRDPRIKYCLTPGHRVLCADLTWRPVETLTAGDELIAFDEWGTRPTTLKGLAGAKMRTGTVEATTRFELPCYEVVTDRGTVVASEDHMWLQARSYQDKYRKWTRTADFQPGDQIQYFADPWDVETSFEAGWLAGLFDGEGCLSRAAGKNVAGWNLQVAQREGFVLDKAQEVFDILKFTTIQHRNGPVMGLHVRGGLPEILRFLGSIPTQRLRQKALQERIWEEHAIAGAWPTATIHEVRPVGVREVVAVQTSTRTLIAEGMFSHNCIWNKTITSGGSDSAPWVRRPYAGTNAHTKHLHLSVRAVTAQYDNTRDWAIGVAAKAPTGAVPGDGILEVGDSGDDVRRLQEVLNRWYPDRAVTADGDFGPATAALVKYFQERAGLDADGVAGAATLRALGLTTPVTSVPVAPVTGAVPGDGVFEVGDSGDAVRRLQEVLNAWYPDRKVAVDGDFGAGTKTLVAYFQSKAGLTADGVAGPATLSALGLAGLR